MRRILTASCAALLVATAAQSAPASVPELALRDSEAACPGSSDLPSMDFLQPDPDDTVVKLDVLVVTEPADLGEAKKAMDAAALAYEPHAIRLVPAFDTISLPRIGPGSMKLLKWLKRQFGGSRPPGVDVVYLATTRPVTAAGRADCIGGVAGDSTAFAVGTLRWSNIVGVDIQGLPDPRPPVPVPDGGGKIAAHEIGHLLGAEHDDAVCGPGMRPAEPTRPCEVMLTTSPQNLGLHFGPLTGAVVRRYALTYARP